MSDARGVDLKEVALLFLRPGFTAFGGPAAHIAMKNPGDVANALTQYSDAPNWMGDAMARLRLGSNRDTPLPGDITAQNRND